MIENVNEPKQARSKRTVDEIIAATSLILETNTDAFTTNDIAKKAGYSVGSLYRFFKNKDAIIEGIAYRQEQNTLEKLAAIRDIDSSYNLEQAVRSMIHVGITAFQKRRKLRRFLIIQIVKLNLHQWAFRQIRRQADVIMEVVRLHGGDRVRPMSEASAFIISRSLILTIRASVMEESSFIDEPEFEDELVRMAMAFILKEHSQCIADGENPAD